jgi:hypothetical protein
MVRAVDRACVRLAVSGRPDASLLSDALECLAVAVRMLDLAPTKDLENAVMILVTAFNRGLRKRRVTPRRSEQTDMFATPA